MLSRKSVALLSALAGVSLLPINAQATPETLAADIDALLDKSYPDDGPGAAVVVSENGTVIYSGGQGLADIEAGTPIAPDTVFRFASITKQFAAATLMQLVDEGKLSLDDPLSKFLPDYPEPGASATVRQLLNHTSGIKSYTGIPGFMAEETTSRLHTTEELVAVFKDQPADFPAGDSWAYNNSGYVLVGAVIEAVTGKPWDQAVVEQISNPNGLSTIASFANEADVPNMAKGYTQGEEGAAKPSQKIDASVPAAAGALRGSVIDLAGWAQAFHGGKVLSEASYETMLAPTIISDGSKRDYGFGIGVGGEIRKRRAIGHSGGIFGFSTDSVYLPEEKLFVAVLVNSDSAQPSAGTIMNRVAAIALGEPYEEFTKVALDLEKVAPAFGVYQINDEDSRQFYERDGQLYTMRSGASESEVFPAKGGRFFYGPNSLSWFTISENADGVTVMEMHQNGAKEAEVATYVGPIPEKVDLGLSRDVLGRYVGQYSSPYGMFTIAWGEGDGLTGQLAGQRALPLIATSENSFDVQGVGATVTFTVEGDVATSLTIEQGGQSIPAERVAEEG